MNPVSVGVVGSLVGGTLAHLLTTGNFDITAANGFDLLSIFVAVLGALISLFVWKRIRH